MSTSWPRRGPRSGPASCCRSTRTGATPSPTPTTSRRSTRSTSRASSSRSHPTRSSTTRGSRQRLRTPIGLDETITERARRPRRDRAAGVHDREHQGGSRRRARRGTRARTTCASKPASRRARVACSRPASGGPRSIALASLPGFTVTGDLSASSRYFEHDVTEPFELDDGRLAVPDGPGPRRRAPARPARPLHDRARALACRSSARPAPPR